MLRIGVSQIGHPLEAYNRSHYYSNITTNKTKRERHDDIKLYNQI